MVTEKKIPENINDFQANWQEEENLFQWTKQWYPVAVVEFLDAARPQGIQLLGKSLVIWCDQTGKWHCFADFCPHRGVPLSEGRVEADGTLLCAYHAWRFNGEGKCVKIPQSFDTEKESKNCANSNACVVTYPTQQKQGLLWVWPESGEQAILESQLRLPRIIPELEEKSEGVEKKFWNIRDLPYGWDYFLENVADPAHVTVSHHGLMGSRYSEGKYYDMIPTKKLSTQEGFAFEIVPTASTIEQAIHDFQPPCHMRIVSTFKDGGKFILALYVIPTRPGWCRHIGCQILVKNDQGKLPKGIAFFALPMPIWLGHILASLFLHQDLVFLHYQEKNLAQQSHQKWIESVYTPNPQDKMVITFRKWLENRAGGGIPWEGNSQLPTAELDKRKLFDVWETHTKDCQVCQKALSNLNRLIWGLWIGAIASLCLGLLLDARIVAVEKTFAPSAAFLWGLAIALILAGGGYFLKKLTRLFYVYEFEHAHND
ncbi:Rieske 2Fe-2S domain-containing protein [Crocosphaera sp. UHCC 0190]|uniref:aromatic ring-hydroxylating dioxygenase subunit alpha n=1 Tax=Crocosphaera sp. UHCC 0190 TaxID=3110246 RepID=UPI002B1FEA33|nr:Rieske 2Fe-2S domain-containing protein [Crocosphaera sp. UHCC 0190]MEA5509872.1 Rieske 2Fe-2S domain-containing protein [Crocosphaera sp. UHCC 0190]